MKSSELYKHMGIKYILFSDIETFEPLSHPNTSQSLSYMYREKKI